VFLVLAASVLLMAWRRRRPPVGTDAKEMSLIYLGGALIFYTFWFFTSQQARFLLPGCLCVILAASHARNMLSGSGGKCVLVALAGLTLWSVPEQVVKHVKNCWSANPLDVLYSATNDEYLKACDLINKSTPAKARILLLYEQRGLYIPRDYLVGTPYFQERFFTPPDLIDDEFLKVLRRERITHVLLGIKVSDPDRMKKYIDRAGQVKERLERLISHGLSEEKVETEIGYRLFRVDDDHKPQAQAKD
jgi:hypothetical protein